MKDSQLVELLTNFFADLHTKLDSLLTTTGQPVPTQQTAQQPTAPVQQPTQTTTTQQPTAPIIPTGFYEIDNLFIYAGHQNPCFNSTLAGKPIPFVIKATDPEIYIDVEIWIDAVLDDKMNIISGKMIEVGQKDNTNEIDIDNLKVQGLVMAGQTLTLKIQSYDALDNQGKGEVTQIDLLS